MGKAKYDYLMDKASDKDTFKAVMFACKMIREGKTPQNAIRTASRYYDCDMAEVAKLIGQRGGRTRGERIAEIKSKIAKKNAEEEGKAKARQLIAKCIWEHDGKPFFISHEEKRLSEETGFPQNWFKTARMKMREEGLLDWETISDTEGRVIGTWFRFSDEAKGAFHGQSQL